MGIDQIIDTIQSQESLSIDDSFKFAKICSVFLRNTEEENAGRKIIVHILNKWLEEKEGKYNFIPVETHEIWTDLIEMAGFYPYLQKEKSKLNFNNLPGEIRKEFHYSRSIDKYLHEEQKVLQKILHSDKNLIVSAPTSFGKSLLIEEMVASKKYKNIVIIQPTLALLDETRRKLKKYSDSYKIIVRTTQDPHEEKRNLFLLTSERVLEYKKFPNIDFLVIDEFYKLSTKRDDERADHLNNAFYRIIKAFNPKFYLLGPNIDGISEGFVEKYNAEFYKTDYSLIDNKVIDIYSEHKEKFDQPKKYKEYKEMVLFDLLFDLQNEQTIIYCSSPSRVRQLASKFSWYLEKKNVQEHNEMSLIEWIEKNISPQWNLIKFLKYQIGINDGSLQKHINSSMIKYFNEDRLKYIFCTTTIIEGVNTSAKNVVIFDSTKGRTVKLDFFDHSNIKGRSGRMMIHYVGKVYDFNRPPKKEKIIVDIPFFEQQDDAKKFPPEIEINIAENDIKDLSRDQHIKLLEIPPEEKEIIKNNGVLVKGQQEILKKLEIDIHDKQDLIIWSGYPKYYQLEYLLNLCWSHLMKKGESKKVKSLPQLVLLTFKYGNKKNVFSLIEDSVIYSKTLKSNQDKSDEELLNVAIEEIFNILRHWFQYKIPKWLSVMNELQEHVCKKHGLAPGNYTFYANQIENDFIQDNLTILSEYGIPKSAIEKISKDIDPELSEDEILKRTIDYSKQQNNSLSAYEIEKINDIL